MKKLNFVCALYQGASLLAQQATEIEKELYRLRKNALPDVNVQRGTTCRDPRRQVFVAGLALVVP
jgi:hypothetical protein